MKWIRYHFSYLKDKKWLLILLSIFMLLFVIFFYLGGGFDPHVDVLLDINNYQQDYHKETFTLLSFVMAFFIIHMSKDIFQLDEPHIILINKRKYIITKMMTYWLYYVLMIISFYAVYQVIFIVLYGFYPFMYFYLYHLIFNATLIHALVVLILGQGKALLKTILLLIIYLILDRILLIEHPLMRVLVFFYPITNLGEPLFGYVHLILYSALIYIIGYYKHLQSFS